ncbi:MAG: bifunctional heptose 7-phosphate kinase/heptose 1-phosphate adenyltransferase [Planctomycetaceae bacterium]
MNPVRFSEITGSYPRLRIAVVGDFFLDRYLEIDPARGETSIETGLPVYNVVNVRSQAGAAGTILNNLVALGVGEIAAVGFFGEDGEGHELHWALNAQPGANCEHLVRTGLRRTPVYCKPLLLQIGRPPEELNRFDFKNWSPTPDSLRHNLARRVSDLGRRLDGLVLMDQVDLADTGVVSPEVADAAYQALQARPELVVLADSRRGVGHLPRLGCKMNAAELSRLSGADVTDVETVRRAAAELAARNAQPVFVTLAERGIVGAAAAGPAIHRPARPVEGPIDVVGAGDAVTANLVAALAAGAEISEAMELAMAAAWHVVHQIGTTGAASVEQLAQILREPAHG